MEKVALGFSNCPPISKRAINANAKLTESNRKTSKSYGILGTGHQFRRGEILCFISRLRRVSRVIGGWISNAYVEDLNLFHVTMGSYADEGKAVRGGSRGSSRNRPQMFMRYQAVFMNMTKGFLVSADGRPL